MIDPKYSLKYHFPHSVVHIVDNSMYTGETVVQQVPDPSLFSTIVVTGLPMGEDNKFISVSRSDVLNTGFGINTLTTSDINKYSQAVEYPMALLQQNVPVKLMRITPDDATYGLAIIMVQWKKTDKIRNNKFEVRFRVLPESVIDTDFADLSEYKNVSRLNKAIITKFNNRTEDDSMYEFSLLESQPADWSTNYKKYYVYNAETQKYENITGDTAPEFAANTYYTKELVWNQRVFMTVISAGRGSAYNRMKFFINKAPQSRRQTAVAYNFGTIDTLNGLVVENFVAALINNSNSVLTTAAINYTATKIDTVNIAVAKRLEGSSVLVPTVNEQAVQEVFNEYMAYFKSKKEVNDTEYANYGQAYDEIYRTLNSSKFDMLYGMFNYKEATFKLPYYQVDMYDTELPKLPVNQLIQTREANAPTGDTNPDYTKDGPVYNTIEGYGATIHPDTETNTKTIVGNVDVAAPNLVFDSYIKQAISQTFNDNNAPAPGDLYLSGVNNKNPFLTLVTGINLKNGAVSSMTFTKVYQLNSGNTDIDTTVPSKLITRAYSNVSPLLVAGSTSDMDGFVKKINAIGTYGLNTGDVIAVSGIYGEPSTSSSSRGGTADEYTQFHLYKVTMNTDGVGILSVKPYPANLYRAIDYNSNYLYEKGVDAQICRKSKYGEKPASYSRLGSLWINDVSTTMSGLPGIGQTAGTASFVGHDGNGSCPTPCYLAYFDKSGNPVFYNVAAYATYVAQTGAGEYSGHTTFFRAFTSVPTGIAVNVNTDIIGEQFDVMVYDRPGTNPNGSGPIGPVNIGNDPAEYIFRCNVQSAVNNTYRVTYAAGIDVPANYYLNDYGDVIYSTISTSSSEGGIPIVCGSTGFFDDNTISDLEFKWKYSALLVRAFRGEIDPRILSPIRVPAFYLFDAGFNTVCGMNVLPYTVPNVEDVIYASTIFTEEEKEAVMYDKSTIASIKSYEDIDVKQAMYDLMIERVYQRIPEQNRPVGPGSGLSLHLDAGVTDAATAIAVNNSFKQRFDNPNASWDIGGYVSAENGVSYTYLMQIVRNCFNHFRAYSVNKPFVGDYSAIDRTQYLSFFPDLDATDWEMRELYYNSGGNAWIQDAQGNLTRRSQRSLYREETGTSDLYQESNMRTLSQFCYLIQSEIDHYLLEYNDDGVIKTMQETVNNKFAGWAGNLVQSYDISFARDYNTDGGDILVCNVNVVFRGLILRVPIIVNVNRRTS